MQQSTLCLSSGQTLNIPSYHDDFLQNDVEHKAFFDS